MRTMFMIGVLWKNAFHCEERQNTSHSATRLKTKGIELKNFLWVPLIRSNPKGLSVRLLSSFECQV